MALQDQSTISFELLLDYVEGLLHPATEEKVKQFLEEDEDYRTVVEGIQYYYQSQGASRSELEAYLADFQRRLVREQVPGKTRRLNLRFLSIAAAVIGLVLSVFLLRNEIFPTATAEQLVAGALEIPYPNIYAANRSDQDNSLRTQLGRWYTRGDYGQIIDLLEGDLKNNPNLEASDYFLLAQSHLNQQKPDYARAAQIFQQIRADQAPASLKQQTEWYLALSLYQSGARNQARDQFKAIAEQTAHYRQSKAQSILEKW